MVVEGVGGNNDYISTEVQVVEMQYVGPAREGWS